ncbi:MAG: polyphosphate kinase 1 [Calditerrivibrio sp.]|nr:polyphosphate kinase 1 [Calditerrivibrio sp.]
MHNLYFNRELSWLSFNERVLKEAIDPNVPLLEKLKFIGIFSSNLDEFFMIRVAGLLDQIKFGYEKKDLGGLTPIEQLSKIKCTVTKLIELQENIFNDLVSELSNHSIFFNSHHDSFPLDSIFFNEILPAITPITISPANPFPFIHNLNINIFTTFEKDSSRYDSIIIIPNNLKKFYIFQKDLSFYIFTIDDIILRFINSLYKDSNILQIFLFKLTRNADLSYQSEEVEDLYKEIQNSLIKRVLGSPVRLEIKGSISSDTLELLLHSFNLTKNDLYFHNRYIDLKFLINLDVDRTDLKYPPFHQNNIVITNTKNLFNIIKKSDLLFFRPYNDLTFISKLLAEASEDPDVISIKMTLYRANKDSSLLKSLEKAALNGKHVCVVIELKARFDEEKNLEWAKKLELAGCIVTYGFVDLKIHAKALIIVRREKGKIVRYTHLSTGNYNEITANLYTDIDFLTCDDQIGSDTVNLFNYIMSYSDPLGWSRLFIAPFYIRKKLVELIDTEIEHAKNGHEAMMIIKINSLYDKQLTDKLYEASNAGVKIDIIVRGICSLIPGLKSISDNIRVKSIIGRFLEHPRVLYFHNNGHYRIFLSTADWMGRNLDRRVEILFEVTTPSLKEKLFKYLQLNLQDNQKSWTLKSSGEYTKDIAKKNKVNLQTDMQTLAF